MMRRTALGSLACLVQSVVHAQASDAFDVRVLMLDEPALVLSRYRAASGALDRFGSRPGAWLALLYLPLWPHWPVELSLRLPSRGHALQLQALDQAPSDAPRMAVSLPLWQERSEPGVQWTTRFVLPDRSPAEGVYVLVELWRRDFAAPPPMAVRLRSVADRPAARAPWWTAAERPSLAAPPSPLTQAARERGAFELPLWAAPPAVRELPR